MRRGYEHVAQVVILSRYLYLPRTLLYYIISADGSTSNIITLLFVTFFVWK